MLGIYIGINSASAVLIEQSRAGNCPVKYLKLDYPTSLNAEDNYQSLQANIEALLDHFSKELSFDYIPIQIALADSLVNSAVFELDQIPAKQSIKNELLAMRFQKDCHINMQNAAIASQTIKKSNQQALYAITAPDALVSLIQTTFKHRHQYLSCMDKTIHYLFNHYYEKLLAEAAMLFNSNEYWTLIIWDTQKNVVYFRSKLYGLNDQLTTIADDVLRLLHTYQQNDQQQVNQLYIIETGHSKSGITDIISRQGDITVSPLSQVAENEQLKIPDNDPALFVAEQR